MATKTKKTTKLDPRTVRADGKGMTKDERAARELALSDAMFVGLTALTEKQATEWRNRAEVLRAGLTPAAIKRAKRRAHAMADDHPPGYIEAMGSMDLVDEICDDYGIETKDMDKLYGAIAQICMFQLAAQRGPFNQAAEDFGLTKPASVVLAVRDFMASDLAARDGKPVCDCPNCRARTPEELN
jgi:hypothetical protein